MKKKYFGEWIKLQLEIQAMRRWQQEYQLKLVLRALRKNVEYNSVKLQLGEMAQNQRNLFNLKSTFLRWKNNSSRIRLERYIKNNFVIKREFGLLKKSLYGWRIWLQEEYKMF